MVVQQAQAWQRIQVTSTQRNGGCASQVCGKTKSCLKMVWKLEGTNRARSVTNL